MAQLVASVSGVVLGGVAEVVGSNLARGKLFTASIGSVDSLYLISQAFRTFPEFFGDSSHMDLYHMTTSANQHNSRNHEAE